MKKYVVVCLTFFLFLFIHIRSVNSLSTGQCRYYLNDACQNFFNYDSSQYEEVQQTVEIPQQISQIQATTNDYTLIFINLVVQFFCMVVLFILLIVLLESILESK